MRKKNNMRRGGGGHGGGHGGGQRRYHNNGGGGGGNRNNDGQNIQRQKHHATQMREKYTNMARDAQNNGDRVDVEYYLQYVDHYNRVLTDIAAIEAERFAHQREQQQSQPQNEGGDNQGGDNQGNDNQGGGGDQGGDMGGDEPLNNRNNQPRMTRGPRHQQRQPQPQEASADNQGSDNEIPLPGSALPAI